MKIRAYIDTNIFIYAITHHPIFGEICSRILRDAEEGVYEHQGSMMVALELLGSLSRIDPHIARKIVELYFAMNTTLIPIEWETLIIASRINEVVNMGYDAIHAAIMILNNVPVIITNDVNDWLKLARKYDNLREILEREGYRITVNRIEVIAPQNYMKWRNRITENKP